MKKRILLMLIVLCIIMSFCIITVSVEAETEFTEGYYTFTVTNEEAIITQVNKNIYGDIIVPTELGGYIVTSIGNNAFYQCEYIDKIHIPDNIVNIGNAAFFSCNNLSSVVISQNVFYIGNDAFGYCDNLENIYVDKNNNCYSSLNGNLYSDDYSVLLRYAGGKNEKIFSIPNNTINISEYAFEMCYNLKKIVIPVSVTSIGDLAFNGCNNLSVVYYQGSESDWNNISISSFGNSPLTSAERVYDYILPLISTEITDATSTDTTLKYTSKVTTENNPEISTFGTTFIPLWLFEEGSDDVATVEYDNSKYDIQNGQTFGATLTGIPPEYKDMDIVGKSFVKTADGNYTWSDAVYSSVNNPTLKTID